MKDGTELRALYPNRNIATPDVQATVDNAIRDALHECGIDSSLASEYQPMIDNVTYDLVQKVWET